MLCRLRRSSDANCHKGSKYLRNYYIPSAPHGCICRCSGKTGRRPTGPFWKRHKSGEGACRVSFPYDIVASMFPSVPQYSLIISLSHTTLNPKHCPKPLKTRNSDQQPRFPYHGRPSSQKPVPWREFYDSACKMCSGKEDPSYSFTVTGKRKLKVLLLESFRLICGV